LAGSERGGSCLRAAKMSKKNFGFRSKIAIRVSNLVSLFRFFTLISLLSVSQWSLAASDITAFEHVTTGFNLTGAHIAVQCETCHIQDIFKGTPSDCISCHTAGNGRGSTSKPANHILTTEQCSICHQTTVWSDATFSHLNLAPGYCSTCHNGTNASGQPKGHVPTNGSCDNCHKISTWSGAVFNHVGIVNGCSVCHGDGLSFYGVTPTHKSDSPVTHVPTLLDCISCHFSTTSFVGGISVETIPANHLPTTQPCTLCHSAGFGAGSGVMNHLGILNGCDTCHGGQVFLGITPVSKSSKHIPTTAPCESCHDNTTNFIPPRMNHAVVAGTTCFTCHNGSYVTSTGTNVGKSADHIPTRAVPQCDACHTSTTIWKQQTFSHVPVASIACGDCHIGVYAKAVGRSSLHIPTGSATCDSCHKTLTTWSPANMDHMAVAANTCTSCHGDGMTFSGTPPPKRKQDAPTPHITTSDDCRACHFSTTSFVGGNSSLPANHIPTVQSCSLCHASGTGPGSGVMNHAGITTGCTTCHNGQTFLGVTPVSKPANHLPTGTVCEACHSTSQFTNFAGTAMNHIGILNNCSNCHNGQVFAGVTPVSKPSNHLPTSAACELCHSASQFTNFAGTAMSHTGILNNCANCHNGQVFAGVTPLSKPSNHLPTTAACELCHSASQFTNFAGTPMIHTGIFSGCITCHNGQVFAGVSPVARPSNHLPTSLACETCHLASQFTNFANTPMNHTGIVSGCTTCHNGQVFAGVTPVSKPVNHLPTTAACEICHSSNQFTNFAGTTMNHVGIVNNCSSCHGDGLTFAGVTPKHKSDAPTTHITTSDDCSSCHFSTSSFVGGSTTSLPSNHIPTTQYCALCHPSGTGPGSGVMNHMGILNGCSTCHNGQSFVGVTPVSKPGNHLPTGEVCELCHSASQFIAFSGATMVHTGILNNCSNCHNGQVFAGVTPVSKPTNHLPTTAACETCHSANQFSSFAGTAMSHTGILNGCINCHNGQVFAGVTPVSKPGNHLPTTLACESCHSATQFSNFAGTTMNHIGIVNNCSSCHGDGLSFAGVTPKHKSDAPTTHIITSDDCSACHFSTTTFTGASSTSLPANHIPITTQTCALCHPSGTGPGSGVMNHTGILNGCATCHNGQVFYGVTPVSKPGNHLPTNMACETCHSASQFANFAGTQMIHTGILNGCDTCHNGQVFAGVTPVSKPVNHLPTTMVCETCHSASKFTSFSGTSMVHTGIVSGCTTCHNGQVFFGVTPVSKPINHLPTALTCETCHSASKFTDFSGTLMNHIGIIDNCTSCHGDGLSFAGVTPKHKSDSPTTHLTTTLDCSSCHFSTTTFTGAAGINAQPSLSTTYRRLRPVRCVTCRGMERILE